MDGGAVSAVENKNNSQDAMQEWDQELNGVDNNVQALDGQVQNNNQKLPEDAQKVMSDMIGNMFIEMVRQNLKPQQMNLGK